MANVTVRKRRITAEDLIHFRCVSDPQLSSDGLRVVYVVKRTLPDLKKYRSHLWITDAEGRARAFTSGGADDSSPRWSPDGSQLAFVRTTEEVAQIHVMDGAGGESRPLTSLPPGRIAALDWSPDGTRLAFVFRPRAAGTSKEQPLLRHVSRLHYKSEGDGFLDDERFHVYVAWVRDGPTQQITKGEFDDAHPAWSPDSAFVAFASNRHADADWRPLDIDLWIVPAGGGEPRRLPKPPGPAAWPVWSPDGKSIAFLGHDRPEDTWGTANTHLWRVPVAGREDAYDLCREFDRTCEDVVITDTKAFHGSEQRPVWSEDGQSITFIASDPGTCHLYRVAAGGGRPEPVTRGQFEVMQFSAARGRFALTISDALSISEVYLLEGEQEPFGINTLKRVTATNDELFGELALSAPEELEIRSFDGTTIQGWLLKPLGFSALRKYPLILEIHGGPRAQYGWAFFHEFQLLAAQGYVVLYTNPRGSQGNGEKFASAIVNDWGNIDYRDLMSAVEHIEATGFVDAKRVGVCGGSYGGDMTNWIVGHTDHFRAAITMRCVSNLTSMFGTSDMGYDEPQEFRTPPWDDWANYQRMSPLTYVANVRTPLLITHGEADLRCPIEQAEQMYTALKFMKREVEMLRFPEENHDLSRSGRPDRRIARLDHIAKWWKRWLE